MRRVSAIIAGLLLAGSLLITAGCGKKEKGDAARQTPPVARGITLESVTSMDIPDLMETVGTVRARNSAQISARISGAVTAVHVRVGDRVGKGRLLLTLEAVERTAGSAGALAGVEEARRGVEEVQARKRLAEATFERYRTLYAEQAVTKQEFENRQADRDVTVQELARAGARLVQAQENSRAAGALAGYTRITAPVAGIVSGKAVDVGMTVFSGTPLMTVEEEGNYRLEVAAPESLLGKIKPGDSIPVAIEGMSADLKGSVAEVAPSVDPASRTFLVKVNVTGQGLRSGMFGRVRFKTGTRQGVQIPRSAIIERGSLTSVWVVGTDKMARMRLVKAGVAVGNLVNILAGLSAGERIVTVGVEKVVDGAKVE